MRTIVYMTPPAHGHVNPTLPVIRELVQRGERVIAYNTAEFRPQLEQAGAVFRAYPPTAMTATTIALLLRDGNLAKITELILRTTEQLLPFMLQELAREQHDLVVFDTIALWAKMAATQLGLRAAASHTVFILDDRQMRPRDLLPMLWQVLPKLPGILATRRRLIPHQFEQLFNARCVAARGAGYLIDAQLKRRPITAGTLRQALASVLAEPRFRAAAQEL